MSGTWYEEATVCPGYQCDVSRRMKLSNLLRRMQQIATDQLAAMGEDYLYFYDRGMVFVLTRVTAQIYRQPVMDEKIRISTSPAGIRGAQYLRLVRVESETGERLVDSLSCWVLIEPESRRLLRPDAYELKVPVEEVDYKPNRHRLKKPGQVDFCCTHPVHYSQVDYNQHLNNAAYADVALDHLPEEEARRPVAQFQIDYHHEAYWGEELALQYTRLGEDEWFIAGQAGEREIFCARLVFAAREM